MSLLAVNLGLAMMGGQFAVQLTTPELKVWEQLGKSLVMIDSNGFATGTAVLLDGSGRFMAHRNSIFNDRVTAKTRSGKALTLRLVYTDEPTQLSLLQADQWDNREMTPIVVSDGSGLVGRSVIAALPTGPIRGEYVSNDRAGIIRPSLRYVPLSEIRFESPNERFGGAFVFTYDGKLAGVLGASLDQSQNRPVEPPSIENLSGREIAAQKYGPGAMTIAYSLGPEVLVRVVEGYRSSLHRPIHPSIGCFFREGNGEGALIEAVVPNSPSAMAGMRVGDLVIRANDTQIVGPVGLAVFLFRQKPGSSISLTVRRGQTTALLPITIGRAE